MCNLACSRQHAGQRRFSNPFQAPREASCVIRASPPPTCVRDAEITITNLPTAYSAAARLAGDCANHRLPARKPAGIEGQTPKAPRLAGTRSGGVLKSRGAGAEGFGRRLSRRMGRSIASTPHLIATADVFPPSVSDPRVVPQVAAEELAVGFGGEPAEVDDRGQYGPEVAPHAVTHGLHRICQVAHRGPLMIEAHVGGQGRCPRRAVVDGFRPDRFEVLDPREALLLPGPALLDPGVETPLQGCRQHGDAMSRFEGGFSRKAR